MARAFYIQPISLLAGLYLFVALLMDIELMQNVYINFIHIFSYFNFFHCKMSLLQIFILNYIVIVIISRSRLVVTSQLRIFNKTK